MQFWQQNFLLYTVSTHETAQQPFGLFLMFVVLRQVIILMGSTVFCRDGVLLN